MIEQEPPPTAGYPIPASLVVQSVTRPKRVAFLYDETKVTLAEIDSAILAATECVGRCLLAAVRMPSPSQWKWVTKRPSPPTCTST